MATYRICVRGRIASSRIDLFEGMSIHPELHEEGPTITTLEGELLDQAALAGVLNTLYTMQLPVLSVECLSVRPAQSRHA